ncbi:hypothetical protein KBY97_01300 [Synechococcus sp. ATX 2A4]|uniref:hypothetical protein n=1 Tax=Synechococcus sp. ATX 2A4 TaxID=2823727 RepID=UPI0020CD7A91|nr:hypothetical protein [Synechococcus sp. ATX 2A4]MCP9883765.1 hypothetical protein [Synechococcus sp. ATX 2A4]
MFNDGHDGPPQLPPLSRQQLETLLAALDPRLDGFGKGPSCLDDAAAFLERLSAEPGAGNGTAGHGHGTHNESAPLQVWLEAWRSAGGNRQTLSLMVGLLLAQTSEQQGAPPSA